MWFPRRLDVSVERKHITIHLTQPAAPIISLRIGSDLRADRWTMWVGRMAADWQMSWYDIIWNGKQRIPLKVWLTLKRKIKPALSVRIISSIARVLNYLDRLIKVTHNKQRWTCAGKETSSGFLFEKHRLGGNKERWIWDFMWFEGTVVMMLHNVNYMKNIHLYCKNKWGGSKSESCRV